MTDDNHTTVVIAGLNQLTAAFKDRTANLSRAERRALKRKGIKVASKARARLGKLTA